MEVLFELWLLLMTTRFLNDGRVRPDKSKIFDMT
jgi:hypothetical protein